MYIILKSKPVIITAALLFVLISAALVYQFLISSEPLPETAPPVIETIQEETGEVVIPLSPFTGLPVEEELLERPFALMIDNHHGARPQYGLQNASYVYEIISEGGITRFLAIFHHDYAGDLGPVRSIRPYYAHLARENDAVMVHCGSSPQSKEVLTKREYANIDEIPNPGYFSRLPGRRAPHNLFTDMEKLIEAAEQFNIYRTSEAAPKFEFIEPPEVTGDVTEIQVPFSNYNMAEYVWDDNAQGYLRFTNDQPHIDALCDRQLVINNIIVQYASLRFISDVHREYIITGSGEGLFIRNGISEKIHWSKEGLGHPTEYYYENGSPVKVTPGNTWIHILSPNK